MNEHPYQGLLTVTTGEGFIRQMRLVFSTAHAETIDVLEGICATMAAYNQSPPEYIFSDNAPKDKNPAGVVFPSLLEGVVNARKPSNLPPYELPLDQTTKTTLEPQYISRAGASGCKVSAYVEHAWFG